MKKCRKGNIGRSSRRWLTILLSLTLAATLTACGSAAKSGQAAYETVETADYDYAAGSSSGYSNTAAEEAAADAGNWEYEEAKTSENGVELTVGTDAREGQKIVYSASVDMQTLEYEKTLASIRSRIAAAGGFIEAENESNNDYNWYYNYEEGSREKGIYSMYMTVRIPSGAFAGFLDALEEDGKVISRSVNAQNISQTYADTETTKKALETELERLLEMMDKAETIEDMIAVESRLTEVERSLNAAKTSLASMDKDVDYSTVYLSIQEVRRYSVNNVQTPFIERLKRAAQNSVDNLVEFVQDIILYLVENWPYILFWIAILVLAFRLIRRLIRGGGDRRKARKAKNTDKHEPAAEAKPVPVEKPSEEAKPVEEATDQAADND